MNVEGSEHHSRVQSLASLFQLDTSQLDTKQYSASELSAIKNLAARYTSNLLADTLQPRGATSRQDFLQQVQALAKQYTVEAKRYQLTGQVEIETAEQVRIAVHRANRTAKIISIEDRVVTLKAPLLPRIPRLNSEYAYKGGAARLALAAVLGKDVRNRVPRDYDLLRFGTEPIAFDQEMAAEFMPDDFRHGNGVELVEDFAEYVRTRDLSINQVVLLDGRISCTVQALRDTLNEVLRPLPYVLDAEGLLQGKIMMKMVRMLAEARVEGRHMTMQDVPDKHCVSAFDVALHLDRALVRSSRIAQAYVEECVRLGFLSLQDQESLSLGDAIAHLDQTISGGVQRFKTLAPEAGLVPQLPLMQRRTDNETQKTMSALGTNRPNLRRAFV